MSLLFTLVASSPFIVDSTGGTDVNRLDAPQIMEYMPHLSFDADAVIHICTTESPEAATPEDATLLRAEECLVDG